MTVRPIAVVAILATVSCHDMPTEPSEALVRSVAVHSTSTCALMVSGQVQCWGYGLVGQLGNGSQKDLSVPTPILSTGRFVELAMNGQSTCALAANDTVSCWGMLLPSNWSMLPLPDSLSVHLTSIGTGNRYACGIGTDSLVYCWGRGQSALGQGDLDSRLDPSPVRGLGRVKSLAVGPTHACAVLLSGAMYCWGQNPSGQLGIGTTSGTGTTTPMAVASGFTFSKVAVGDALSCGLSPAGEAFCWGVNYQGNLGDGTTTSRLTPTRVATDVRFRSISAAGIYGPTCAISLDDALYCWGPDQYRELGPEDAASCTPLNANPLCVRAPQRIEMPEPVSEVDTGLHLCAVLSSGRLVCWGANSHGQLGDGTLASRSTPTPVHFQRQ